jgi:hypothetical protein
MRNPSRVGLSKSSVLIRVSLWQKTFPALRPNESTELLRLAYAAAQQMGILEAGQIRAIMAASF